MEQAETGNFKLIERAKAILLSPKTEWDVIANEPASVTTLYRKYAMILAAIPAVAQFLHSVALLIEDTGMAKDLTRAADTMDRRTMRAAIARMDHHALVL